MRPALLSTAVLLLAASAAHAADPPLWDAAREPRSARDVRALRDAERAFLQARLEPGPRSVVLLEQATRTLERIHAASSPDPRVRFFYGRLLVRLQRDEQAVPTLNEALRFAPEHPGAVEALFSLAVSLARLGRTHEEIDAYHRWLDREPDPQSRTVGLSNLAEGFMAAGRLDDAIRHYRSAIAHAHDNALAHWGLAVALDRAGDPPGALHEAAVALTYDPDAKELNGPNVFFVPPYDRFWYRALGTMSRASGTPDPSLRALWWDRAALLWQQYLDASPIDDRWRPIARVRHALCERAAREAQSQARRHSPTRP